MPDYQQATFGPDVAQGQDESVAVVAQRTGDGFAFWVSNNVPVLVKALVESFDATQVDALFKILVLLGSKLPENERPSRLADLFAAHLAGRI